MTPIAGRSKYDLSRLTEGQLERMAELRGRVDAVELSGPTDGEVEEGGRTHRDPAGAGANVGRTVRALGRRVAAVGRVVALQPSRAFLAYARAVVAYGGGEEAEGLSGWLEGGRPEQPGELG